MDWPAGSKAAEVISSKAKVQFEEPKCPTADPCKMTLLQEIVYRRQGERYADNMADLESSMKCIFTMALNYVSHGTELKLKGTPGYEEAKRTSDPIWLLEKIEDVMADFDCNDDPIIANIF